VLSNPCAYVGYQLDFGPDMLAQSYGSHDGYVQQVTKDVKRLVKEGWLLPQAAREQIATARASNILT
jgi:Alpha/beta hydrolase domain